MEAAAEEIQNLKKQLSGQKRLFDVQQGILMNILGIPPEERNFSSLRDGLTNLKNDYNQLAFRLKSLRKEEKSKEKPKVYNTFFNA